MNYFKKYIEYLKDNKEGYWFKRKLYGWGWTPAKWQGWVVIGVFILVVSLSGISLSLNSYPTGLEIGLFLGEVIFSIITLILICYKKGEKPKWQWGLPKKDSDK